MAWQTPKTNWGQPGQTVPIADDFNRIEGNIQHLQDTKAAGAELDAHKAENASTSQKGHVQLSTSTTSTSTTLAATASAVNAVRQMIPNIDEAYVANRRLFTANGTFVVPPGVTTVYITGCGGGGRGGTGRIVSISPPYVIGGGGGGGAASVFKHPCSVTPGQSIAITIGAGGSGSSSSGGQSGGTTSFGSILSISGGQGGYHASEGGDGGRGGSSPVPIFAGTSGNEGSSNGGGSPGRSCFVKYGNGSKGGYIASGTPIALETPAKGQDGFLLIEW